MCHTKPCLHAAILSWHLCSLLHRETLAAVQLGSLFGRQSGAFLCNGMRKELRAHGVGKFRFAPAVAQAAPSPTTCQSSSRVFAFHLHAMSTPENSRTPIAHTTLPNTTNDTSGTILSRMGCPATQTPAAQNVVLHAPPPRFLSAPPVFFLSACRHDMPPSTGTSCCASI
jgi:hypothetical protein